MSRTKKYKFITNNRRGAEYGYQDFRAALRKFGFPYVEGYREIYRVPTSSTILMVEEPKNVFSLVENDVTLVEIKDGHLTKICIPGLIDGSDWKMRGLLTTRAIEYVTDASFPDLKYSGLYFMQYAFDLLHFDAPNLKTADKGFMKFSQIPELHVPCVTRFGENAMCYNEGMHTLDAPNAGMFYENVLYNNNNIRQLHLPKAKWFLGGFMGANTCLTRAEAPKLRQCGPDCHPLFYDIVITNKARHR